jgi:hypothetical protein
MTETPSVTAQNQALPAEQAPAGVSVPSTPSAPAREWNPLAVSVAEEFPLKVSGGAASVLLKRWTGRERLAYEDALTERMLTTDERTGEDTVRIGTLRLYALSLTVVGSKGFPARSDGTAMFTGDRDLREADLLALEADTFNEIRELATKYQPLPRIGEDDDDASDSAGDDTSDPSRTPSTPPPVDGVVTPGSPPA